MIRANPNLSERSINVFRNLWREYVCPGARHMMPGKMDGPPEQIPSTTNPLVDGWHISEAGDVRFSMEGRRVWICPECYAAAYEDERTPEPSTHWDGIEI